MYRRGYPYPGGYSFLLSHPFHVVVISVLCTQMLLPCLNCWRLQAKSILLLFPFSKKSHFIKGNRKRKSLIELLGPQPSQRQHISLTSRSFDSPFDQCKLWNVTFHEWSGKMLCNLVLLAMSVSSSCGHGTRTFGLLGTNSGLLGQCCVLAWPICPLWPPPTVFVALVTWRHHHFLKSNA